MNNKNISANKVFVLDNKTPEDVAKAMIVMRNQTEPFFVFDLDEAYRRIQYFKKMMPRVQIFYAVKANGSDHMLKLASTLGLGFDCASPGEISKILKLNVSPLSIVFAVPAKAPEWMRFARESGVKHTTFDSSYELEKIKKNWPDACLLIRIKIDGESTYKLGEKFGCDFETEAIGLLEEAAGLDLKVVGVAFHVGSVCSSADSHILGLRQARALFDHETKAGRGMNILDIGGGFLSDRIDRIDQVSQLINNTLEELFPDPAVQVIAEPGRYLCDTSCNLYCSINNVRRVKKDGEAVNMIYMSDGIFGTLRLSEPWHTVKRFERDGDIVRNDLEKTILWGPSCHSIDRVMENVDVMLPRCTPLDWLVFTTQGAYTHGFSSYFSCLEIPLTRSVISNDLWKQIKGGKFFSPEEFITNPDISSPLPSTISPIVKSDQISNSNNTLKVQN